MPTSKPTSKPTPTPAPARLQPLHIVLIGSPLEGYAVIGPFASHQLASDYIDELKDVDAAWVSLLMTPDDYAAGDDEE